MSSDLFNSVTSIALAIIGLAIVATLVSKSANTSGILSAGGSALGGAIAAAESPVSGSSPLSLGSYSGSGYQEF